MAQGTIGFRPNREDQEILDKAMAADDVTTTDIIRRALRLLDKEMWRQQANADAQRMVGEDLSDEPDDWT